MLEGLKSISWLIRHSIVMAILFLTAFKMQILTRWN